MSAEKVTSGVFTEQSATSGKTRKYSELPTFCRVQGLATPVAGSRIGFEVWLPDAANWSQRLHMVGNGGYGSNLYYAQLATRIRSGDVAVATDTGHTGDTLTFGKDNPEAIVDWGNRAVHESVVAAKAITVAYLGKMPAHSYFSGSSTGGHEALTAAQRHPDDFDGIIAGAPGNNRTNLNLEFLWEFVHNHHPGDNEHPIVPEAKLSIVNAAAVRACDAQDGVSDGVINDPRECHFNLQSLLCKAGEQPDCLTAEQVTALQAIYAGPRDARNGKQIYPPFPFGSEGVDYDGHPGWSNFWSDPDHPNEPQRVDFFRYWVFHNPGWNWWEFNWGSDVDTVTRVMGPVVNATNPDLGKFRARGGKLIMFMGWADPVGAAPEAINYYDSVVSRSKAGSPDDRLKDTQSFARLYMVPGMSHTAHGPGATNFSNATRDSAPPVSDPQHDMALALQEWVEDGKAPAELIATHYSKGTGPSGTVQFQRPLCVYPQVAKYVGGDTSVASSFKCQSH